MNKAALRDHGVTAAVLWLLAPFVFASGLVAVPGWTASWILATPPDAPTIAMTALLVTALLAMALVARSADIGGVLAIVVGIMGMSGTVLLATSQGDSVSTRWFPLVVVVVALALTTVSIRWIRSS